MISQANVPLMRKHATGTICGTDAPNQFTTFLNMDLSHSLSILRDRTSPVTGVLHIINIYRYEINFLPRVLFYLRLHTMVCSVRKDVTGCHTHDCMHHFVTFNSHKK